MGKAITYKYKVKINGRVKMQTNDASHARLWAKHYGGKLITIPVNR